MSQFKEALFTTSDFAKIAKLDRDIIHQLEADGLLEVTRKKVGNVEKRMVSLESAQRYFHSMRELYAKLGTPQLEVGAGAPVSSGTLVATATVENLAVPGSEGAEGVGQSTVAAATNPLSGSGLSEAAQYILTNSVFVRQPKHKIQMFYNVKGGTGKSTMTAQYVMRAAMLGYKILAIDLDGQGHLSLNLDVLDGHERPTVYDVLINDLPIRNAIVNVAPGLDLVPANLGLCNIEIPLNHKPRREYRLSEAIQSIAGDYDLIVADTNPAASILNSSMLVAAELVNVVCATNPLSFHGMSLVISTIEEMEREFKHELALKIIPNMYDNREIISQEVLGELRSQFQDLCTQAVVNRSADINEATKRRTSVLLVNPRGTASTDINALTEELLFS